MRMPLGDEHEIPRVVAPAKASDERSLWRQREAFDVGVEVCELESEVLGESVNLCDLEVVVLLIAHDDQPTTARDESAELSDVGVIQMVRSGVGADCGFAGVCDEEHVDPGEVFFGVSVRVDAHIKIRGEAAEDRFVGAVGQIAGLADRVEVAAVEQDGFGMLGFGGRAEEGQKGRGTGKEGEPE